MPNISVLRLTLLACIANQLITPPGGFAFVDIPVCRVIHRTRVCTWLRDTPHLMSVRPASEVGIHHVLEGRMLRLLALQGQDKRCFVMTSVVYHITQHHLRCSTHFKALKTQT